MIKRKQLESQSPHRKEKSPREKSKWSQYSEIQPTHAKNCTNPRVFNNFIMKHYIM